MTGHGPQEQHSHPRKWTTLRSEPACPTKPCGTGPCGTGPSDTSSPARSQNERPLLITEQHSGPKQARPAMHTAVSGGIQAARGLRVPNLARCRSDPTDSPSPAGARRPSPDRTARPRRSCRVAVDLQPRRPSPAHHRAQTPTRQRSRAAPTEHRRIVTRVSAAECSVASRVEASPEKAHAITVETHLGTPPSARSALIADQREGRLITRPSCPLELSPRRRWHRQRHRQASGLVDGSGRAPDRSQ